MQEHSTSDQQFIDPIDPDVAAEEIAPGPPDAIDATLFWSQTMLSMLVIAVGAAVGANLRYGVSLWATQRFGTGFPFGTLIINASGSLVIGLVMALITTRIAVAEPVRLLIVTGFLGGFTTFSSFSYEAYTLANAGHWLLAAAYVGGSVLLGMVGVIVGAGVINLLP